MSGPDRFGNNYQDGYSAKPYDYKPAWEKDVERSPDKQWSKSGMWIEDREGNLLWCLQVKGAHGERLGAIVMRAETSYRNPTGELTFMGLSSFTFDEIHTGRIDESEMGKIKVRS